MGGKLLMSVGSSPTFIVFAEGNFGPDGPTGPTGPTGTTGNTGSCLPGNTGQGITAIGIRGSDLGITFGSGNTLTLILNASLKGPTGTTKTNTSLFNFKGTTTEGISVIVTADQYEYNSNSVTYDVQYNGTARPIKLRGVTFQNITILNSTNGITLTGIVNAYNLQGNTGDLVYVDTIGSNYALIGASGNSWNTEHRNITLTTITSKEKDVSGLTLENSNYRTMSIDPVTGETTLAMPIAGYAYNSLNVVPVSTIDGTTYTQQALYIKSSVTKEVDTQLLYFPQQEAITSGNKITFTPQTHGITYGSCWYGSRIANASKRCLDYTTKTSCEIMGGTFSEDPCSDRSEVYDIINACCVYNYSEGGVTCINTFEDECDKFMGIFGNIRCNVFEDIMDKCPSTLCFSCNAGKCCFKGKCYALTEQLCYSRHPGASWFDEACT